MHIGAGPRHGGVNKRGIAIVQLLQNEFIDGGDGELGGRLARQEVEDGGEVFLSVTVVVVKQLGNAGIPLETPVAAEAVLDGAKPLAGLAGIAKVNHGAHHAQRDFGRVLVLGGLHGLAEGLQGLLWLRIGSALQQAGAYVIAVQQWGRQGGDDFGGGDLDGAIDAVDKLIRAEDQVLGAKGGTLRREKRMLGWVLQAVADGNDLAQHAIELGAQLLDGGKATLWIRVRGAL